jgi:hypothetical protein
MRLRFVEHQTPEDRRKLKPAFGDTVLYEGREYVVREAGMKYLRVFVADKPGTVFVVKAQEVVKMLPKSVVGEVGNHMNYNP